MNGKGDRLARGDKSATFSGGYGPGELRPAVAPETDVPAIVDNSALFAKKIQTIYYKGRPLADRILIKRVAPRENNSVIVIPDSAKGKSDAGIVVSISPLSKLAALGLKEGSMVLFDKFAAVGQEINLLDAKGEESEHLIVQDCDILMELEECRHEPPVN